MKPFAAAQRALSEGIKGGAFPAAVVEVGHHDEVLWQESFGSLGTNPENLPTPIDAVFDLASLTKVLATTSATMTAVDQQLLQLTDRVGRWLPEWRGDDRTAVTLADLLAHASGLTPHMPFFRDCQGRAEFQHAICTMPLEYQPHHRSVYSDLGFILLGFILEDVFASSLDATFQTMADQHSWGELRFRPPARWRTRTAPTEIDTWRGRLYGGRGARRERMGPRRRGGALGDVRNSRRGRPLRPDDPRRVQDATNRGSFRDVQAVHDTHRCARQFSGAGLGHDASDLLVRNSDVTERDRSHRVHGNVIVDRSSS